MIIYSCLIVIAKLSYKIYNLLECLIHLKCLKKDVLMIIITRIYKIKKFIGLNDPKKAFLIDSTNKTNKASNPNKITCFYKTAQTSTPNNPSLKKTFSYNSYNKSFCNKKSNTHN